MAERLLIEVQQNGEDAEVLLREVDTLRRDLLELDVERVERAPSGPAPPGTRAGPADLANILLVTLPAAMPVLQSIVSVVGDWRKRAVQPRRVVLKVGDNLLDLTGIDAEEESRLTEVFLRASGLRGPEDANRD
ncbi:hypothetical protein [Streptomyces sp. NPDC058412]|uniref:hypothetical protein n=1 Tax=unclassified Streptomyces TaxID=2593676 RepID=UPI00365A2B37